MLISTITSNIPFIQLSLMHRITEKICKERWQHWCTKISGVKVLPTLLISTITSNMSLMLSGYPASSLHLITSHNRSSLVPRCQDVSQLCFREAQPCSSNKEPNCDGATHMAEKPCPSNGDVDEVEGEHFAAHFEASGCYQIAHGRAPADLSR